MIKGKIRPVMQAPVRPRERALRANLHNRFDVEVRDAITGELKQKAQAFNCITNKLWTYIGSRTTYFKYIAYGNGTGEPSAADTTLFGTWYSASASTVSSSFSGNTGIASLTKKITLSETTAVGVTITELGIAYNGSGTLCTHAMLQDMNGNPISITKTSTDIITIYATVYAHWDPDGINGVYLGSGLALFLCGAAWPGGTLSFTKGMLTGATGLTITLSWASTLRTMSFTAPRIEATEGNVTGFGWARAGTAGNGEAVDDLLFWADLRGEYQITGESVGTGDGSTTSFGTAFDLPSNAKVYVDGVLQESGVTVRCEPLTRNATHFMVPICGEPTPSGGHSLTDQNRYTDNAYCYLYNPLHEIGLTSYAKTYTYANTLTFGFSDDLINWTEDYGYIPSAYRHYKYLRVKSSDLESWDYWSYQAFYLPSSVNGKNIVFDTAPASGAVITIDYATPFVPKDANHVYDFTLKIRFGEYTEEV